MATVTTTPPVIETLADLLDRLGVPPNRIRYRPPPGTATEADVLACLASLPQPSAASLADP